MLTWIPLLVSGLTWWIFAAGVPRDLPVAVVDEDRSSASRTLARMVAAAPGVDVAEVDPALPAAMGALRERRAYGVLIFPSGLERDLVGGRSATVHWIYNGQFATHGGLLSRDLRTAVATASAGIELLAREKRGASVPEAEAHFEPVRLRLASLFNEGGNYEAFLGLALIPALLQIFVTLAAVSAIGRELKAGTVPAWLAAGGGRWSIALLGKLSVPAVAFAAHAAIFLCFFTWVRGWRIEGSLTGVAVGLTLLIVAHLAIGALLVGATLHLRVALALAAFVTAPAFAYSGQGFPLLSMPLLARVWAEALPLTHYLQAQGRYWLAGAPLWYGWGPLSALSVQAGAFGVLGWWLLRRRAATPDAWGRT